MMEGFILPAVIEATEVTAPNKIVVDSGLPSRSWFFSSLRVDLSCELELSITCIAKSDLYTFTTVSSRGRLQDEIIACVVGVSKSVHVYVEHHLGFSLGLKFIAVLPGEHSATRARIVAFFPDQRLCGIRLDYLFHLISGEEKVSTLQHGRPPFVNTHRKEYNSSRL